MTRLLTCLLGLLLIGASAAMAQPYDSCIFISEYCEGSSFNKAIEIYNATEETIDLSGLEIAVFFNGAVTPASTVVLPAGPLPVGGTFVVCHPSADPILQALAGLLSTTINFNGDDAVVLRRAGGGNILDAFGQIGFDPGTAWVGNGVSTLDRTLRRVTFGDPGGNQVCCGDPDGTDVFDPSLEWISYAVNTFDGFGRHVTDCRAVPTSNETWGTLKGLYR